MSMEIQLYVPSRAIDTVDTGLIEQLILKLGDAFNIRIVYNADTALLTGVMAVAGGVLGGYSGGRLGAALGASIGGAAGYGASVVLSLREIWHTIKEKLHEIFFIVLNYLRRLDAVDYINAAEILMTSYNSRRELVGNILEFIAHKLGRQVLSSLTAA